MEDYTSGTRCDLHCLLRHRITMNDSLGVLYCRGTFKLSTKFTVGYYVIKVLSITHLYVWKTPPRFTLTQLVYLWKTTNWVESASQHSTWSESFFIAMRFRGEQCISRVPGRTSTYIKSNIFLKANTSNLKWYYYITYFFREHSRKLLFTSQLCNSLFFINMMMGMHASCSEKVWFEFAGPKAICLYFI